MNQQLVRMNIKSIEEKFKSKKELYIFLLTDCHAFLPSNDCTNVYFLKQILRGDKKYLKRDSIKLSAIPQIEGLTAQDFLDFARKKPNSLIYFPDEQDWLHLDKHWICDVLSTLYQEEIEEMVTKAMAARKLKFEEKQNLCINMKSEFADAFLSSQSFSSGRGKGLSMCKDSARRKRKRAEMEGVEEEERKLNVDRSMYLQESKRLKKDFALLEEEVVQLREFSEASSMRENPMSQIIQSEFGSQIQ